jgi:hypothetical protein
MQSAQTFITGICHDCDGYGVQPSSLSNPLTFSDMMSPDWECESCGGSGLASQSGDLCRFPVQSPDVVGRESNHKFLSPEPKITRDSEESNQAESDHQNGLEIIPHSLRLGGLRKEAVLLDRHEKESPLSITSGLLSHGETNS